MQLVLRSARQGSFSSQLSPRLAERNRNAAADMQELESSEDKTPLDGLNPERVPARREVHMPCRRASGFSCMRRSSHFYAWSWTSSIA